MAGAGKASCGEANICRNNSHNKIMAWQQWQRNGILIIMASTGERIISALIISRDGRYVNNNGIIIKSPWQHQQ
jgi:hypothetical protein